jgi:hypothetical protein
MDGFQADLGQLTRHADTTTKIGERAGEAADAGRQVADMDDAYGLLCRPIAWILKGPQDKCAEAIGACADALQAAGKKLTDAVTTYQDVDDRIGQTMEEFLDGLESNQQDLPSPKPDEGSKQGDAERQGESAGREGQRAEEQDEPNERRGSVPDRGGD